MESDMGVSGEYMGYRVELSWGLGWQAPNS